MTEWKFLTNHAHVLLCVAHEPQIRLREIAEAVGITERAAHRIIAELEDGGYISRERRGRRNLYRFHSDAVMSHPNIRNSMLGELTSERAGRAFYPSAGSHQRLRPNGTGTPLARRRRAGLEPPGSVRSSCRV